METIDCSMHKQKTHEIEQDHSHDDTFSIHLRIIIFFLAFHCLFFSLSLYFFHWIFIYLFRFYSFFFCTLNANNGRSEMMCEAVNNNGVKRIERVNEKIKIIYTKHHLIVFLPHFFFTCITIESQ